MRSASPVPQREACRTHRIPESALLGGGRIDHRRLDGVGHGTARLAKLENSPTKATKLSTNTSDPIPNTAAAAPAKARAAVAKTRLAIHATAQIYAPVDTGQLMGSMSSESTHGGMGAEIGPTAEHGIYQELGTSEMSAQPYLGPAFDLHIGGLADALGGTIT